MEYTEKDTNKMSWEEFGEITGKLITKIISYSETNNIKFDAVIPILRSGMIPGTMIAVNLKILRILPVQVKSNYKTGVIDFLLDLPQIDFESDTPNILVAEANTFSGKSAKTVLEKVYHLYPKSNLYYSTLTKAFGTIDLPFVKEYFHGIETNEMFKLTEDEAKARGIRQKITIYPWENLEDELGDINASL